MKKRLVSTSGKSRLRFKGTSRIFTSVVPVCTRFHKLSHPGVLLGLVLYEATMYKTFLFILVCENL